MESMELEVPGPSSQEDNGARRSKVCAVCGGESQTYHLNFGVGTCNSCRAFFRRSVQVGEKLNYILCLVNKGATLKTLLEIISERQLCDQRYRRVNGF